MASEKLPSALAALKWTCWETGDPDCVCHGCTNNRAIVATLRAILPPVTQSDGMRQQKWIDPCDVAEWADTIEGRAIDD